MGDKKINCIDCYKDFIFTESEQQFFEEKGYSEPNIIEDPAPYTVEIGKFQNYGDLLKNSVESYPLRDKIVLVMKDMVWVEQALVMGAIRK